jgi:chloramphenicol-sensitive protein RarD
VNDRSTVRQGLLYALGAYGCWGVAPLYFKAIAAVSPYEVLAHRVVWSLLFLGVILTWQRRWGAVFTCLTMPSIRRALLVSAVLVAINWLVYIYGVATSQILQTSLGYFINPLVSVLLGTLILGERLRGVQILAVLIAACGVLLLANMAGEVPWIALSVALSFGFYGLIRKVTPVDGLIGLSVETLVLTPVALGYLLWLGWQGGADFRSGDPGMDVLLLCSGIVTSVPLLCFGQAARRLPLTTLGFMQYLAPSLQFLLAVFLYDEPFLFWQAVCFGCIWAALALYSLDSVLVYRRLTLARAAAERS